MVRWTSTSIVGDEKFYLSFGPLPNVESQTGALTYNEDAYNVRSELLNLGNINGNYLVDEVDVSRSVVPGFGFEWSVTFMSKQSQKNVGAQVPLRIIPSDNLHPNVKVEVVSLQPGSRAGGLPETQLITLTTFGSTNIGDLGGWFRLSFKGVGITTAYLQVGSSAALVQRAINQLHTIRDVTVSLATGTSSTGSGSAYYQYTVVFSSDVGNQQALGIDSSLLYSNATSFTAVVSDGDNSLSPSGWRASNAVPGEAPLGYNSMVVDKDTRAYVIDELVPGTTYYVAVSAINGFGTGPRQVPAGLSATPPKQIPQPPVGVAVSTHVGSSSTLDVTYATPLSDGGSPITQYRIELDISTAFTAPIYNNVHCAPSDPHTVYQITSAGLSGDPVVSGYFQLGLSVNGNSYTTDYIPYDATASSVDESGVFITVSGFTATMTSTTTFTASNDVSDLLFPNDRIRFSTQVDQTAYVVVQSVSTNLVTLASAVGTLTSSSAIVVQRLYGGRGSASTSRVACSGSDATVCSLSRRQISGSMQSKFEMIPNVFVRGVQVDRDQPSGTNGATWRVTFLDKSPAGPNDFTVTLVSSSLLTLGNQAGSVTITRLVAGTVYSGCTGIHQVPQTQVLTSGQYYYARVFAVNEIGYSLPAVSPTKQKPMIPPGPPTSVTLSVLSKTSLKVSFNPPASDGGDTITKYNVEYATRSDFSDAQSVLVTNLAGGAPFYRTLDGLVTGTFYFIRVSAYNSQGYGVATASTPTSLNPREAPGGPSNVRLGVTANSLLTVSFGYPTDDGGDLVKTYRVEWDISGSFNSPASYPNKGSFDVDASISSSYTIQYLTAGVKYYVQVYAKNSEGFGAPTPASPPYAIPALEVPGKPHTIAASPDSVSGSIFVSWQRPRIPWHGIPCSGLVAQPQDCPTAVGGGPPLSNGGSSITEYLVSYNEQEDFSGLDSGEQTTTATSLTLLNLTPGRQYYIRVLARNAQGSGQYCSFTDSNCLIVTTPVSAVARP